MSKDGSKIEVKTRSVIEKYPDGTTEEDIRLGKVEPIETIVNEDVVLMDKDEAEQLGLKVDD